MNRSNTASTIGTNRIKTEAPKSWNRPKAIQAEAIHILNPNLNVKQLQSDHKTRPQHKVVSWGLKVVSKGCLSGLANCL